jgi:hypothetical protein
MFTRNHAQANVRDAGTKACGHSVHGSCQVCREAGVPYSGPISHSKVALRDTRMRLCSYCGKLIRYSYTEHQKVRGKIPALL